ncbi:hypothetical protein [Desulfonatronovibrio magnus]|uniref:hypothetical protein n=1 Tax=Desulfonatronovibrio magnus TaxID=698827 RepID=UPI0012F78CDE|nr:hypothetical protein [Desulfonatronovibrio magnus]
MGLIQRQRESSFRKQVRRFMLQRDPEQKFVDIIPCFDLQPSGSDKYEKYQPVWDHG